MRGTTFLALLLGAFVLLSVTDSGQSHPFRNSDPYVSFIDAVNRTVIAIQSSQSDSGSYLWDLMNYEIRVVLLTQKGVTDLGYNVTAAILAGQTNLTWATIPANVQSFLLNQKSSNVYLNLTFAQWGFVADNSSYANYTLGQFLSSTCAGYLPTVQSLLGAINFDTRVNTTALLLAYGTRVNRFNNYYGYSHRGSRNYRAMLSFLFGRGRSNRVLSIIYLLNPMTPIYNQRCGLRNPLGALLEASESCFNVPRTHRRFWH